MTARNDITGDVIATKSTSDAYRSNYDAIFRKKEESVVKELVVTKEVLSELTPEQPAKKERDEQTAMWWAHCEQHQREHAEQDKPFPTFEEFRGSL